jgi:hypothetical protein
VSAKIGNSSFITTIGAENRFDQISKEIRPAVNLAHVVLIDVRELLDHYVMLGLSNGQSYAVAGPFNSESEAEDAKQEFINSL